MDEAMRIRNALNDTLSGADKLPSQQSNVLSALSAGKRGRRPISAAVVFAIVLLLAAGALAAVLLGGREFTEKVVAPIAKENEQSTWTKEQQARLHQLAVENGFTLTKEIEDKLLGADALYKEELMRAFVKLELGDMPAMWSLADQAWYDELLYKTGLIDARTRFLPQEGEISEEAAIDIALKYINERFTESDVTGEGYTRYVQYMLTSDAQGRMCKRWDIEFEGDGYTYCVIVTPEGLAIAEESYMSKSGENEPPAEIAASIDELTALMKNDVFYTAENMARFKSDYGELIARLGDITGTRYSVMRNLCQIPYALPKPTDISEEAALRGAEQAAIEYGWTREWLDRCKRSCSYRVYDASRPEWRVCYKIRSVEDYRYYYDGAMPFGIVVTLDAATGEAIDIWQLDEIDRYDWYCEFPDKRDSFTSISQGVG